VAGILAKELDMEDRTMSQLSSSTAEFDGVALIGFRLDADSDEPSLHTLLFYGERDVPLMQNDRIVFFTAPELADVAYELGGDIARKLGPPPTEVCLVCDFVETLRLIRFEGYDNSATILDFLNTVFDLVKVTTHQIPSEYKTILFNFADHLTFHKEFASFFMENRIERDNVVNGILWCLGAVVASAKLLTQEV
jgi:hypothetical protein